MKKIFATILTASLMFVGINASAQVLVGAGYISSTLSGQYNGNAQDPQDANGFYVGGSFNIPLSGDFGVAPGAYFSLLTKTDTGAGSLFGVSYSGKSTFTEMALNIPVMANYSYALNRDTKFFAYAGPTFQLGLSSKTKSNSEAGSGTVTINSDSDHYADGDFNKFNLYLGGGLGAQVAKFMFVIGYDYGILNLYAGDTDNTFYHRANLHLGVGYAF